MLAKIPSQHVFPLNFQLSRAEAAALLLPRSPSTSKFAKELTERFRSHAKTKMNKQVTEEKDKKMKTIGRKLIQSGTTGKRFVERKTKERQKESDISKTLVCMPS